MRNTGTRASLVLAAATIALFTAAIPSSAGAQDTDPGLQVDEIVRQLKPSAPPPGVRTRGLPGSRGISVELPAGSAAGTDTAGDGAGGAPTIDLSIEFDFNSHTLTADGEEALHVLGKALTSDDLTGYRFLVAGHTDASGGDDYNQILSELRARTVKDFLTANYAVTGDRLVTKGYGESRLKDPNRPEDGVNRRVQVTNLGEN